MRNHGLISFIIHPDYIRERSRQDLYESLLEYLTRLCARQNVVHMLPREVSQWWRQRDKMQIVRKGSRWTIKGEGSERARLAYAMLRRRHVVFEIEQPTLVPAERNIVATVYTLDPLKRSALE